MNEREDRNGAFKIDSEFERILLSMNDKIAELDEDIYLDKGEMAPLVAVCFSPRSGSTLLMQHLALSQKINYFSGFNARYWKAPIFSQLLESKLNLRSSLTNLSNKQLNSVFGYSDNVSMPHEFGFFWNSILTGETHWIDPKRSDESKLKTLVATINSIRRLSDKPFVIKNGIASYNIKFLKTLFPDIKILNIHRDIEYVIQSNYLARKAVYGDFSHWFSIIPREYNKIIESSSDPIEQIARQIKCVQSEFAELGCFSINYSELCDNPNEVINNILSWVGTNNSEVHFDKIGSTDVIKVDEKVMSKIYEMKMNFF